MLCTSLSDHDLCKSILFKFYSRKLSCIFLYNSIKFNLLHMLYNMGMIFQSQTWKYLHVLLKYLPPCYYAGSCNKYYIEYHFYSYLIPYVFVFKLVEGAREAWSNEEVCQAYVSLEHTLEDCRQFSQALFYYTKEVALLKDKPAQYAGWVICGWIARGLPFTR